MRNIVNAPQSTAAAAAGIQAAIFICCGQVRLRPLALRHVFVVDSLDKQMQNEKELIRLASAKGGGAILYLCGEYLT